MESPPGYHINNSTKVAQNKWATTLNPDSVSERFAIFRPIKATVEDSKFTTQLKETKIRNITEKQETYRYDKILIPIFILNDMKNKKYHTVGTVPNPFRTA
jgi:hypothetical protein